MKVRADWTLELLLDKAIATSDSPALKTSLEAAKAYIRSAPRAPFRGGKALLDLLNETDDVARATADPSAVLVGEAVAYAMNLANKTDIEDRYGLLDGGRRSDSDHRYVMQAINLTLDYCLARSREAIAGSPDMSAADLVQFLTSFREDMSYLEAPADSPGRYRLVRGRAEHAEWLRRVLADRIDIEDLEATVTRMVTSPEAVALLAADDQGQIIIQAAELSRRQRGLDRLRAAIDDPTSQERHVQQILEDEPWIFGGRFVGVATRRRLVPGDEVDIPLLRPDGSLTVVELKQPRPDAPLVKRQRNGWIPGDIVNSAVGQARNYLLRMDEHRDRILADLGIDTRRATAVVVVGRRDAQPDIPPEIVSETLRCHFARQGDVDVLTYDELLDNAQRSLAGRPGIAD